MEKSSVSKTVSKSTLIFLLVCGVTFVTGYAVSLKLLRSNIVNLTTESVSSEVEAIGNFVDSRLQTAEDVLYSSFWAEDRHGAQYYWQDFDYSEDVLFSFLENILELHPEICGVGFGLNRELYPSRGKYGFAPFVTNIDGENKRIQLGVDSDYSKSDWYRFSAERKDVYWNPFCKTADGRIVSSFSLPLRDEKGDVCGVFALNFNLERIRQQCQNIVSMKKSVVTILDRDFCFISHPDVSRKFTNAADDGSEMWNAMIEKRREGTDSGMVTGKKDGRDFALYFNCLERTGWLICMECPLEEIYGQVNELKSKTGIISILSLLIIGLCFAFLYLRMHRAILAKASLEADMKIAEDLQMGMLPKKQPAFPKRKDMDIYGFLQPAKEVGGDLYDYVLVGDKLFFCIGDVSGKGVPAAMFMSIVVTHFHNKVKKVESPAEIVSSLNELLTSQQSENMFCTFFLGILNLRSGRLDYCNAGHDAPIMIRKREDSYEPEFIEGGQNLVIGALPDIRYTESHITMRPGDSLFLFTDGVTEAENKNLELFGVEAVFNNIRTIFESNGTSPACDKVMMMYEELRRYSGKHPQSDDITMLMMEYKGTTLTLENRIGQLSLLSRFVKDMCGRYSIPENIVNDIDVSADEIGTNIILYAFPQDEVHNFYVYFHYEAGELVFTFEDDGVPFDPTQPIESHLDLPPKERPLGGLGIMLVKALMDKVEYERRDDRNIVCIVKKCE